MRSNHLSSPHVAVGFKPCGSATMKAWDGQPLGISAELQGVASDRVYSGLLLPGELVSSYLAFPSLPSEDGGIFLLHFPGGHPRRTLSVILPCDARTFLAIIPFGDISRDCPAQSMDIIHHTVAKVKSISPQALVIKSILMRTGSLSCALTPASLCGRTAATSEKYSVFSQIS